MERVRKMGLYQGVWSFVDVSYSNGYIADVIDERAARIRDRLADERDMERAT